MDNKEFNLLVENIRSYVKVLKEEDSNEKKAEAEMGRSEGIAILEKLRKEIFDDLPNMEEQIKRGQKENVMGHLAHGLIGHYSSKLATLVTTKVRRQLDLIEEKTKKERIILHRLAPEHFNLGIEGKLFKDLLDLDNSTWKSLEVFWFLDRFRNRVQTGRYLDRIEDLTNYFIDEAIEACRDIGI